MDDVKRVCRNCKICAKIRPRFYIKEEESLIKATRPWERISIDFKGPVPGPAPYIFIVTDEYSRYPFAFPCKDMSSATVIRSPTQLFVLFGLPMYVHSDRGAAFMARDLRNYLVKRGIAASRSTPYHPTGNSQLERTNKTIWKTVQLMVCDQQIPVKRWQDVLPDALHAVRSLLCTSTNSTPHERFFGFERRYMLGKSLSSWLLQKGPVLLRRFVRNKDEPLVDEVDLLNANPSFAHIRFQTVVKAQYQQLIWLPARELLQVSLLPS